MHIPDSGQGRTESKWPRRASPRTGKQRGLREVAAELAHLGYMTSTGRSFAVNQVVRPLDV